MPTNRLVVKETIAVYASTLFYAVQTADGQDGVLEVRDQLAQIAAAIRGNVDLSTALSDGAFTPEQRGELARGVFAQCNPALAEVLGVMAERNEINMITRVAAAYEEQLGSKLNLCVVDVTTVVPLDDHLREVITKKAETELGMNVVLNEHVDKSLLGGIIMSVNGRRIDASMRFQLDNARTVLKQATVDGGEC